MPARKTPLITGELYHVFNHGIDYRDICSSEREYKRLLLTLWFYHPKEIQLKLSHYLSLPSNAQQQLMREINSKQKQVEIHSYCLMPNHYHLVLKQIIDNGISLFVGNFQNSFTKYYNSKHERRGSLLLTPFHSKHIYSEELYLHVTRYIHLNRFSSGFVKDINQVRTDIYTSLPYYLHTILPERRLVHTEQLERMFSSPEKHWEFVQNNADYQRQLEHIKHIVEE